MKIRTATPDDCAGLARVQVDSYRTAYAGLFPPAYLEQFTVAEQEQDWRDWLASETEDVLFLAETEAGEVVGYALGRPGPPDVPGYDSELLALHVQRWHQKRGVGRQLVSAVARALKEGGCTSLMLWVLEQNVARGFYEQLGGQLLSERKVTRDLVEVAYGWDEIEILCR